MKKTWLAAGSILLAAALVWPAGTVYGAGSGRFLEGYAVEGAELKLFCAGLQDGTEGESYRVSLSGQELPITGQERFEDAWEPVTYFCLTDVSGSMGDGQMEQMREIIMELGNGLQEGDNLIIGTMGNQVETGDFLSEPEAVREAASELAAGREDTNLYAGIVESIRTMQASSEVNRRKCLVILSDGEDDQQSGITREEASEAVESGRIPVYTVAVTKAAPDDEALSYAKLLGSFARSSVGGAHYTPSLDGQTGAWVAQDISGRMGGGVALTADISGVEAERDLVLLRVSCMVEGGSSYEDSMEIYAEELTQETADEEAGEAAAGEPGETEDTGEEQQADMPEAAEDSGTSVGVFAAVGAVLLAAVIGVFVVVWRKKKQKTASQPQQEADPETDRPETAEQEAEEGIHGEESAQEEILFSKTENCELRLYAVGYGGVVRSFLLEKGREVTIGRNEKADLVLDQEDRKLSGVQCSLKWENGKLYVQDKGSLNGTFVNGIPIQAMGRVAVHDGETIRMGSYEYRIELDERPYGTEETADNRS